MNVVKRIYTIGNQPFLPLKTFMQNLNLYLVNCVVDVRKQPDGVWNGDFQTQELKTSLNARNIWYLPFTEEFGIADESAKRRGNVVYDKLVKSERFLRGVDRLTNGADKGYTIAMLGDDVNPEDEYRYKMIGRYLYENGWEVWHILANGSALSQEQVADKILRKKNSYSEHHNRIQTIGLKGEELACGYLVDERFTVLERNWNLHKGCELDIVAFKDNVLHAVEVKTRYSDVPVAPEMAIDDGKMKNIIKAFNAYRNRHNLNNLPTQMDSIAVILHSDGTHELHFYPDIVRHTKKFYY